MKKVLSVSSNDFIENNASLIFSALFYFCGLLVGAFLYKNTEKLLLDTFKKVFSGKNSDLVSMIISRSGFYLSIFCICIILAVCVEGFRIINVIPIFCGIGIAIKLSYYYSLSASGIGFAALLIIPQASLFMTLLIFTIKNCAELSRQIYLLSIKRTDMTYEIQIRSYLKKLIIYAFLMTVTAVINAVLTYAAFPLFSF